MVHSPEQVPIGRLGHSQWRKRRFDLIVDIESLRLVTPRGAPADKTPIRLDDPELALVEADHAKSGRADRRAGESRLVCFGMFYSFYLLLI